MSPYWGHVPLSPGHPLPPPAAAPQQCMSFLVDFLTENGDLCVLIYTKYTGSIYLKLIYFIAA